MRSLLAVAGLLLVLGCRNVPNSPSKAPSPGAAVLKAKIPKSEAITIASREAVKLNLSPNFLAEMVVDASLTADGWNVVFSPKRQPMYGGGVRVLVDKDTGVIAKTIIGQ